MLSQENLEVQQQQLQADCATLKAQALQWEERATLAEAEVGCPNMKLLRSVHTFALPFVLLSLVYPFSRIKVFIDPPYSCSYFFDCFESFTHIQHNTGTATQQSTQRS